MQTPISEHEAYNPSPARIEYLKGLGYYMDTIRLRHSGAVARTPGSLDERKGSSWGDASASHFHNSAECGNWERHEMTRMRKHSARPALSTAAFASRE